MYPVLYSFRRCPYAIRTRMAIHYAGITVQLREVDLRHKPTALLEHSAKATVPVLVTEEETVIDESLKIMQWALSQHDPDHWLLVENTELIDENDSTFKKSLDHYKYAVRFPQHPMSYYRQQGEVFLGLLEGLLAENRFLGGHKISLTDIAIFPFIRQFAFVDREWFDQSPYENLKNWLNAFLTSDLFLQVMKKHVVWKEGDEMVLFPARPE